MSDAIPQTQAIATAIFCDDIRIEVGNKVSYIGVYRTQLMIPKSPWTLPKLFCVVTVRMPLEERVTTLDVRILSNGDVLSERRTNLERTPEIDIPNAEVRYITVAIPLVAIEVESGCVLRARVYLDGREIRAGGLRITLIQKSKEHRAQSLSRIRRRRAETPAD